MQADWEPWSFLGGSLVPGPATLGDDPGLSGDDPGTLGNGPEPLRGALGLGEPTDVLLIGYSQGASVAEMLAAREPERFTRLVLIAKPSDPEPWRFRKIKAVVTMAGTRDDQARMQRASRTLGAAGVKARYFPLPGATHGEMGDDPEGTFEAVLDWLHAPSSSPG